MFERFKAWKRIRKFHKNQRPTYPENTFMVITAHLNHDGPSMQIKIRAHVADDVSKNIRKMVDQFKDKLYMELVGTQK